MLSYVKSLGLFAVVAAILAVSQSPAEAAPFNKKTVIAGTYLMGTSTLAEYDEWVALYPDYAPGFGFTFNRNGTVSIFDEVGGTETGTYVRFGPGGSRITVTLTSSVSPWGVVTYELYRVGNSDDWWGEVRIGGLIYGHFRGEKL